MATHSSVLAWRIPGTGEPGGLPSMEPHRVGHEWSDLAVAAGPQAQSPCPHSASCLWWWERGGQEVCSHQLGPFLGGRELWSPVGPSVGESSEILILAISKAFNGLPRRFSGKESSCQCRRRRFDPWVRKIPWRRKWPLTLVFLLEKSHGQKEPERLQIGRKREMTQSWKNKTTQKSIQLFSCDKASALILIWFLLYCPTF